MSIILAPLAILLRRKKETPSKKYAQATATASINTENGLFSRAFVRLIEAQTEKAQRQVAEYRRIIGLDQPK